MSANKSQGTARGQPVEPELKDIAFLLGGAYLIKSFHTGMETGNLPKIVVESSKTFIEAICRFPQSIPYFLLSYLGYKWADELELPHPYLIGPASALTAYHAILSMNPVVSSAAAGFLAWIGIEGLGMGIAGKIEEIKEQIDDHIKTARTVQANYEQIKDLLSDRQKRDYRECVFMLTYAGRRSIPPGLKPDEAVKQCLMEKGLDRLLEGT